jgi:hydroxyethylthiazole kinase-like uncharacterized protein yjeF
MENAGSAVAEAVRNRFGPDKSVAIVCGPGGNGGDGFVAARHLAGDGYPVRVFLLGSSESIRSEETLTNWRAIRKMRFTLRIQEVRDSTEFEPLEEDVVVDALIGTGVKGTLASPFHEAVDAINASGGFKIAVDIPTGVESDAGAVHGAAVKADLTLTFHRRKMGFKAATKQLGEVVVCPIGVPPEAEIFAGPGDVYLATKPRLPDSHKGDFGRLLVVGGSEIYTGAPALTAMGAYATGIDLVYVAAPEAAASIIAGFSPNLITIKLKGKRLTPRNAEPLKEFLDRVETVAIGPGLGLHNETIKAVNTLVDWVEERRLPLLLDADGLKGFAQTRRRAEVPTVFTPHSGEFEVLTGKKIAGDFRERGEVVRKEASRLGAVILLKGRVDVVSDGSHTRYNWTGNPGMTVGGTGDVLSGITAAFMAMGIDPFQASVTGAFINGAAGDVTYKEKGYHLVPSDLIERIPSVVEDALAGRFRAPER